MGMTGMTLAVLVENKAGVLFRVAGLFSRRGYNIESLAVSPTDDPTLSRITIGIAGSEERMEQVEKQLQKLVDVLHVTRLEPEKTVARELALIKVAAEPNERSNITQLAELFRAKVVDVGKTTMIIEVTGDPDKIDALIELCREIGIREVVRTGIIALARGAETITSSEDYEEDDIRWQTSTTTGMPI